MYIQIYTAVCANIYSSKTVWIKTKLIHNMIYLFHFFYTFLSLHATFDV